MSNDQKCKLANIVKTFDDLEAQNDVIQFETRLLNALSNGKLKNTFL